VLDGVLHVVARHLDLEADAILGQLFDRGLHRAAILPALASLTDDGSRRRHFALKKALRETDLSGVRDRGWVYLACVLGPVAAVALLVQPGDTGDLPFFVHVSQRLFSAHWSSVFADPSVQVGPLELLLFRVGDLAGALALVVQVGVAALLWVVSGRLLAGRDPRAQLLVGLAAVGLGLTYGAYQDGHPAQVVVPLLWVLAALDARDGRMLRAGAIVGLSAGFETWGVLGVVVFVLAPRMQAALVGMATGLVVAGGLFLPFVATGQFHMFDYRWQVNGDTLLGLFVEPGTPFTWLMRLCQGLAALGVGALLAWPLRRTIHAVWLGPLAVVVVRLALDPVRYPWYWLALETLALLGAAEFITSDLVRSLRSYSSRGSSGSAIR
jgi:hypothetical protein